jgi:hypothetical protein
MINLLFFTSANPQVMINHEHAICLVFYKLNKRSPGFLFEKPGDGNSIFLIPHQVNILLRLANMAQVNRIYKLIAQIHRYDPAMLFKLSGSFWDFLNIYVQQRTMKIETVRKRLFYEVNID